VQGYLSAAFFPKLPPPEAQRANNKPSQPFMEASCAGVEDGAAIFGIFVLKCRKITNDFRNAQCVWRQTNPDTTKS
jgi:hypothetical protein